MSFRSTSAIRISPIAGSDEQRHRPPILPLGAGLAVGGDILLEEPPAELGHDRLGLPLRIGVAGIYTLLRLGQDLVRRDPCLVRGDAAVLPDGEPAQLPAHAGLEDVVLPARLPDADAEAGQLPVPVDGIGAVGLEGLDGAPGEFRNAVCHGRKSLTPEGRSSRLANYWQTFCTNSWLTSGGTGV